MSKEQTADNRQMRKAEDFNSSHSTCSSTHSLGQNAISSIVAHYSQAIHWKTLDVDGAPYFDSLLGKPANEQPTHFLKHCLDELLKCCEDAEKGPPKKHMIVGADLIYSYFVHVRSCCFQIKGHDGSEINCSTSKIYVEKNAHVILIHYERFLRGFVQSMKTESSMRSAKLSIDADSTSNRSIEWIESINSVIHLVQIAIKSLFHDIIHLTCIENVKYRNKDSPQGKETCDFIHIVKNWILPILMRVLQHAIEFLLDVIKMSSNHIFIKSKNQSFSTAAKKCIQSLQSCLSYGAIVASTFSSDYKGVSKIDQDVTTSIKSSDLSMFEILPDKWKEKYTLRHLLDKCAYSPYKVTTPTNKNENNSSNHDHFSILAHELASITNSTEENISDTFMDVLNDIIIDFDKSPSSKLELSWLDHTNGIAFRTGRSLLQQLDSFAIRLTKLMNEQNDNLDLTTMTAFERVLQATNLSQTIELIRANFFGRLDQSLPLKDDDESQYDSFVKKMKGHTDKLAFNGISKSFKEESEDKMYNKLYQIEPSKNVLLGSNTNQKGFIKQRDEIEFDEPKPFIRVKARVCSSIRLLASIKAQVWSQSLPIIYSLIDCNDHSLQSLGGALFLHLLNQSTPTSFLNASSADAINCQFESAVHILSSSIRSNDDAVSLAVLTSVRSYLFSITQRSTKPQIGVLRRVAISETMSLVKKRSYCGPSGEPKLVASILANLIDIHYLLEQVAMQENADGMEIGRLGLSTLLPLIRWDSTSIIGRRTQFVAIVCLNSLIISAYPIMEKHGGKIMSELVYCIGRTIRDSKISSKVQERGIQGSQSDHISRALITVAFYLASLTLIICGVRANDVLRQLEEGHYTVELVETCKLIRKECSNILWYENEIRAK